MKVLCLLPTPNTTGGTSRKYLDLAKQSHFEASGVEMIFYFWTPLGSTESLDEFSKYAKIYQSKSLNFVFQLAVLLYVLVKERPTIIQTQFFRGIILAWVCKLFYRNTKIIACFVSPFLPSGLRKYFLRNILRKYDKIICVSHYVESALNSSQVYAGHTSIVYNGTNFKNDDFNGLVTTQKKDLTISYVAGLVDWKNHSYFIKIVDKLIKLNPDRNVKGLIIGDGPERASITKQILNSGLKKSIKMTGYAENIPQLLQNTDIYLHTATNEGFGVAVIEAMSQKCLTCVVDSGALPELIDDERTGLILDLYNAENAAKKISLQIKSVSNTSNILEAAYVDSRSRFSSETYFVNSKNMWRSL